MAFARPLYGFHSAGLHPLLFPVVILEPKGEEARLVSPGWRKPPGNTQRDDINTIVIDPTTARKRRKRLGIAGESMPA